MVKTGEVRAKYEQQITDLKKEIAKLEANSISSNDSAAIPPAAAAPLAVAGTTSSASGGLVSTSFPSTNQMMQRKLADYQSFVSAYVVNAQEEKVRAVREAEKKVHEFYRAKGAAAGAAQPQLKPSEPKKVEEATKPEAKAAAAKPAAAPAKAAPAKAAPAKAPAAKKKPAKSIASPPNVPTLPKGEEVPSFTKRNEKIKADGKESRWISAEVDKAASGSTKPQKVNMGPPPESNGAAAGKETGATKQAAPPPPASASADPNVEVLSELATTISSLQAKIEALQQSAAAPATAQKEMKIDVSEADHGMRNDGGVGGATLKERVNFGADLLANDVNGTK